MIFDKLENLNRYKKLFPELFEYIKQNNLNSLTLGKHEISEDMFVLVNEYETNSKDIEILENHKKNIDFQIVLSGSEKVAINDSYISIHKKYDDDSDYELVKANPFFIDLKTSNFIVFYPNEYHHPGINIDNPERVKKIVFKLKIQDNVKNKNNS